MWRRNMQKMNSQNDCNNRHLRRYIILVKPEDRNVIVFTEYIKGRHTMYFNDLFSEKYFILMVMMKLCNQS